MNHTPLPTFGLCIGEISFYSFSRFLRNASPVFVGLLVALFGLGHLSLSSASFDLKMVVQQLRVDDVVYGVGGAFDKRLRKVTKVNPSKPAVEDSSGCHSCY
jgi:hypothetical protein